LEKTPANFLKSALKLLVPSLLPVVKSSARDMEKGRTTCASFLEPGRIEPLEMDNKSLASVRSATQTFLSKSS
jgi:hypothetical protein